MEYIFDVEKFKKTFNVDEKKNENERRLTHVSEMGYRLFPNKTKNGENVITDMREVIGGFFRHALNVEELEIDYDGLCQSIFETINVKDGDKEAIADVVSGLFFNEGKFSTSNLGLYPYKKANNPKDSDELAYFLFCVLADKQQSIDAIKSRTQYKFNVLESIVECYAKSISKGLSSNYEPYQPIYNGTRELFIKDLAFMLKEDMTSEEELANLFSLYYFQYYVQTVLILDKFFAGSPDQKFELYYALDWEKVSKNRKCCTDGWDKVKNNIYHSFSHKTTLGILNNHVGDEKLNYFDFNRMASESLEKDDYLSKEIEKAEKVYTSYLGDYTHYDEIKKGTHGTKTEIAIKHLFECVEEQFLNTSRHKARRSFGDVFILFCKERWIKDRKKSGLVLNLTERDIIFLTKLSIGYNEKIRLNDMFKEYEKRGVYLDRTSKELLQEYFAKLNIIDKKSDSGDAQYVRRIL